MKRSYLTSLLGVLLVLTMLLGGCAPQVAPTEPAKPSEPTPTPPQETHLRIAYHRDFDNLYPGATTNLPNIMVNFLLYDGLVIHDNNGQLRPLLAKEWKLSDDGKVYTFYLRDDVYFHSGNKFTAKDVKAHFDNWKKLPSAGKIRLLERTVVVDDYTVECHLSSPSLVFLTMITQTEWAYGGIPEAAMVEKFGDAYGTVPESISGTGPFKLHEWVRGDRVTLVKNEQYTWGSPAFKNTGPAHIDKVTFFTMPESATRTAALETGTVDMDLSVSPQDAVILQGTPGITVFTMAKQSANQIGFNMSDPLLQEDAVRFAFAYAINQQDIIDIAWNGFAEPVTGFWHNAVEGHTPDAEIASYHRQNDPEKAKQILEEAGWKLASDGKRYKDGKPLEMNILVYSGVQSDISQVVQEQVRQVGITLTMTALDLAAIQDMIRQNKHQLRYVDGSHSTADFAYWYITDSIPLPNYLYWSDETYDRLFQITQTTIDNNERVKAFQDIEKRILETQVLVPMPHHTWIVAHRDFVEIEGFNAIQGIYKLMDTKIKQ